MFYRHFAIFLFFVLLGMIGFSATGSARAEERGFVSIDPPQAAPPFSFENGEGKSLDLKDFRGRYVLLNLWETNCAPCVSEMPNLNALSKKLDPKKYAIIALAGDHDGGNAAHIFFKRHSIDHLSVYSDSSGQAPFILHARGLPTTFLIDPRGKEIAKLEGAADWTKDSMLSFLANQPEPQP